MKFFIRKVLLYLLVVFLIALPGEIYMIKDTKICIIKGISGSEVLYAINKSHTKKVVRRIIIGDSVGNQLYPSGNDYDSTVSLACNGEITMAGQYFLLKNFIDANEEVIPEEVILLITPFSLSNDVDEYAYQNFLKPFPPSKYSVYYTEHLTQRIHSIPLFWTANLPFIQTSNYTPQWAIPSPQSVKSISPLSYEYLLKIDSITSKNNMAFRMVSTPVRDDRKKEIESFWKDLDPYYLEQLFHLLQPYKESIVFMPADCYVDNLHLCVDKIPKNYLEKR